MEGSGVSHAPVPIYVISLPRATARRAQVAQAFAQVGLDYELIDGVDGRAREAELLRLTDLKAWRRNMGAPISAGHMGCYASHVMLWRKIAAQGPEIALICEDDISFTEGFNEALVAALSAHDRWDILRFSCIRSKGKLRQARLGPFDLNAYWGPFTGNGCYLIKRETAAKLAAGFFPIRRAHDHELNRFFAYDFRLMGLEPFTAPPRDQGESYITGTAMSDARKFPKYKRLPHYAQKAANYLRRVNWLAHHGMLRNR
jgi:glycosyl transferase family 25